ncbi:MAG: hypothetical protein Q9226_009167 [Calogaya cf. arnoldii]
MSRIMFSRVAVLFTLAASALAQDPTTTAPLQSFLSISGLDASQATEVSTRFDADRNSYYAELRSDPAYTSALGVAATGMPASVKVDAAANPELFLASLAQAQSEDLPSWFTALPTDVQDTWKSVGNRDIEMYSSEVRIIRPLSAGVASSLSSVVKSITSSATSVMTSQEAVASSKAAIASAEASIKAAEASASALKEDQSGAPASPLSSGKMGIVAGGVAIAAALVGMALL